MPMRSPMRSPWGPMRASGAPTAQDLSPNRRTLASHHWRRRAFQVVRASLDQSVCAHHWRRRASRVNARIVGGCLLAHHGPMLTIQMNLRPALNKLVMYVYSWPHLAIQYVNPKFEWPLEMASRSEVYSDLSSRFTLIKVEAPAYGTVTSSQGHVNHLITIVTSPLWRVHLSILVLKHFHSDSTSCQGRGRLHWLW